MKGYKGFEKGLICRGKQYAENTVFEEENAEICKNGMHFCKNPFDVLNHYGFVSDDGELNEFCEVEALDEAKTDDNIKYCTKKLKVGVRLGISGLVNAFVNFTMSKVKINTENDTLGNCSHSATAGIRSNSVTAGIRSNSATAGDYSHSATAGDYSHSATAGIRSHSATLGNYSRSATAGIRSHSATLGDYSHSAVSGEESIAISTGIESKAKGALGCYIALAEWEQDKETYEWHLINFKSHKVDGKTIKPDVFYMLKGGKFVEAENEEDKL